MKHSLLICVVISLFCLSCTRSVPFAQDHIIQKHTKLDEGRMKRFTEERNLIYERRFDDAIDSLNEIIAQNPDDHAAYFVRGIAKEAGNDPINAIVDYDKAIELAPDEHVYHVYRGRCKYEKGDKDSALVDFNKAIGLKPTLEDPNVFFYRGLLLLKKGKSVEAMNDFTRAKELHLKNRQFLLIRGQLALELGDNKTAGEDLEKYVEIYPDDSQAWILLGNARFGQNQMIKACSAYKLAQKNGARNAGQLLSEYCDESKVTYYWHMGIAQYNKQNYSKAIEYYEQGLKLDREDPFCHTFIGNAHAKQGHWALAEKAYSNALNIDKKNPGLWASRSAAKKAQGNNKGALDDMNEAIKLARNNKQLLVGLSNELGLLLQLLNKPQEAKKAFDEAILGEPDNPALWANRAITKAALENFEEALQDVSKAIEIAPQWGQGYLVSAQIKLKALKKNHEGLITKAQICEELKKAKSLGAQDSNELLQQHCQ